MDIREAVTKAGGPSEVARACGLKHPTVIYWCNQNSMPTSEWKGESQYSARICELAMRRGISIAPRELCPAGQYMTVPDSEAA